jgi:hypothetical protein
VKAEPTLWGWDVSFLAFAGLLLFFVGAALFWMFFSSLPMPQFCGGSRYNKVCGWISRDRIGLPNAQPQPWPGKLEAPQQHPHA